MWEYRSSQSGKCSTGETRRSSSFQDSLLLCASGWGVSLLEVYEVLLMDSPIYPFLVRTSSTSLGKRRASNACNSRMTAGFDDGDPLSGE